MLQYIGPFDYQFYQLPELFGFASASAPLAIVRVAEYTSFTSSSSTRKYRSNALLVLCIVALLIFSGALN
jgi:hypothetical protein